MEGYSPWTSKELDTTERLTLSLQGYKWWLLLQIYLSSTIIPKWKSFFICFLHLLGRVHRSHIIRIAGSQRKAQMKSTKSSEILHWILLPRDQPETQAMIQSSKYRWASFMTARPQTNEVPCCTSRLPNPQTNPLSYQASALPISMSRLSKCQSNTRNLPTWQIFWAFPVVPGFQQTLVLLFPKYTMGCLSGSNGKQTVCNVGDPSSIPGSGRSLGEGNGNPLQYSCLGNAMDRGVWQADSMGSQKSYDLATKWQQQQIYHVSSHFHAFLPPYCFFWTNCHHLPPTAIYITVVLVNCYLIFQSISFKKPPTQCLLE